MNSRVCWDTVHRDSVIGWHLFFSMHFNVAKPWCFELKYRSKSLSHFFLVIFLWKHIYYSLVSGTTTSLLPWIKK